MPARGPRRSGAGARPGCRGSRRRAAPGRAACAGRIDGAVRVSFRTRDLVVVSWPIARDDAERLVPRGLEPSALDGRYLISVVAMRHEGTLRYGQINI
ncbi:MAG: DUF2071 domain-containing protein, partial [Gaiellaceae bacterium]